MRLKIKNIIIALAIYLYLFFLGVIISDAMASTVIVSIYVICCMLITAALFKDAEKRESTQLVEFLQAGALESIGEPYGSFHHVFSSNENVTGAFQPLLNSALTQKLGCSEFKDIVFKDIDPELKHPELRGFLISEAPSTLRQTNFALICSLTRTADVHGVRWWVLVSGPRDPNKVFWRYVLSPLIVPFVIVPYLKRKYNPLRSLSSINSGFFNSIDILSRTREIHFVAFETLVEVLDSFGIDTSDLKQQKGNMLNINVSGGQTSFGSVVQGAMNKVSGTAS